MLRTPQRDSDILYDRRSLLGRYSTAAYTCLAVALAFILGLGAWGAWRDWQHRKERMLQAELAEVKSHAQRTVRYIERLLIEGSVTPELNGLPEFPHWQQLILSQEKWTHAAIENSEGRIVAHSNPAHVGKELVGQWYEQVVPTVDGDIVETQFADLTEGRRAYDARAPIMFNGKKVGTYHAGLSADWFDKALAAEQEHTLFGWIVVVGGTALVMLLAVGSVYLFARQAAILQRRLDLADTRRVNELSQFVAGLAHEVRNPLNLIRLNLHVIGRVHRDQSLLSEGEFDGMIRDSVREIGRVAALIHEMVGYARNEPPRVEKVDLNLEIRRALDQGKQSMEDLQVVVVARLPAEPSWVRIDRSRLRQVLLNLLNNAREAVGKGGRIEVVVASVHGWLELSVSDDGPGVPQSQRYQIFEPFYSTKDAGIGLGLALVKKFVDESGGEITYESTDDTGGRFLVRLPQVSVAVEAEANS